ncbi:MAG: AmmeMemoRadiSam system protein B [Candidatus Cloacimonetes bacterium]|nr:AmmeMemoRadiSam system protein B [Candidatus Cloacimonadota bacterium]
MIRKAMHAGTFYPRFGNQIHDQISKWIQESVPSPSNERCLGLVVPHAGYIYSGACAALGFASAANERFDSIIVIHPSHRGIHFDFSVSPFTEYESPLGNLPLDGELYKQLSVSGTPNVHLDYHQLEHSLEIQLPLIKYFFPQSSICPIMIGNQVPPVAERLAELLYDLIYKSSKRILIVVSTDLSHYHAASKAEEMDMRLVNLVKSLDPEGLWDKAQTGKLEACGIGGVMTLLQFAHNYSLAKARIISYTHSGKVSGMNNQVVGYLAARVFV